MPQALSTIDSLHLKIKKWGTYLPQEKVYLHLDNTCYFTGDTIWYKGYVTRSDKGTLTDLSKILYVELLTPDGFLVERQQLEMPNGTANGAFTLTDSLYAGYYELRAYTRWMLNFGQYEHPHAQWSEDAFYNKEMAKDFFRDYEKLYSRVFPVYDKPKETGHYTKDMTLRPLRRYFKARKGKPELELKFYPEGGNLIAGTDCNVALELNTEEGEHLENVEIDILGSQDSKTAQTRTGNRGRCTFLLNNVGTQEGYKAVFQYKGHDYEVKLPEVKEEGIALQVRQDTLLKIELQRSEGLTDFPEGLALQVMAQGVPQTLQHIDFGDKRKTNVTIPLNELRTGVNQITVFDGKGKIYADRLCFVNRHDYDSARIDIHGIEPQYEPFAPVTLNLKLKDIQDTAASVSLAVRDRATEELTYDNGTMLTEMLLASEIKGFVENPGYYFEADDSMHRRDLDLLLMVQGWRRYEWKEMAGIEAFSLRFLPEKSQTIKGQVNHTYSLYKDNDLGEEAWITALNPTSSIDFYTTEKCAWTYRNKDLQDLYGSLIKKLDKDVNVFASFAQGNQSLNLTQKTTNGHFYMITPKFYEACIVDLIGTTKGGKAAGFTELYKKGYDNEEQYPNYYVKLDLFYPKFPHPYGYYQDLVFNKTDSGYIPQDSNSFFNRHLPTINISNKRNGMRKLDLDKPAVVMDAYEAFNLISDYGLNGGKHDWRTFSRQLAFATVGDMGLDRRYFIQEQYDGKPLNLKISQGTDYRKALNKHKWDVQIEVPTAPDFSNSKGIMKKYRLLRYLDKIYIYTDYAPREQGSWKYAQDNQPEVIIDYRLFPNDGYQRTYRDRHYILRGYAVCEDFYSPDYSRKPLPDTKDYRRTLLWIPEVKFDEKGEATVRLFNNSKQTVISVEAEGITGKGIPIVYKK
ncbi:hypothetical protein [Paraprevotella xylaniphila]|uniref:hypothetical protein n=1 Tax=Paraprevotella xylaniphila TaxID=454155 RepID=UPI00266B8B78|nr:hypothetical protein [Paraprevotella xylaniphila]